MFDNNLLCLNFSVKNILKFESLLQNLKVNSLLKDNYVLKIILIIIIDSFYKKFKLSSKTILGVLKTFGVYNNSFCY